MRELWLALLLASVASAVEAQHLPPPSRFAYKCESGGKLIYTDVPCLSAKKLDIEPTRGLTTTGKERAGRDVQHEVSREQVAGAIRPLTGMDAKQLDTAGRRMKLSPEVQHECRRLDSGIASLEAAERGTHGQDLGQVQSDLLTQRQRFRTLRCNG